MRVVSQGKGSASATTAGSDPQPKVQEPLTLASSSPRLYIVLPTQLPGHLTTYPKSCRNYKTPKYFKK